VGTESEMDRFMNAFEDIFAATASAGAGR